MSEPEIFVSDVKAAESDVTYHLKSEIARLESELAAAHVYYQEELAKVNAEYAKLKGEVKGLFVTAFHKLGFNHREAVVKANESMGLHPQTPEDDTAGPHGR